MSKEKRISGKFRKWCHILHRDLSFFFAGVILIYAFSGIMLNHKRDFNSDYSITQKEYRIAGNFPKAKTDFSKAYVLDLLDDLGERNNYTQHYFPVVIAPSPPYPRPMMNSDNTGQHNQTDHHN